MTAEIPFVISQWTSKSGEKRSKIYCNADIINFLSGNTDEGNDNIKKAPEKAESLDLPDDISQEDFDQIPF